MPDRSSSGVRRTKWRAKVAEAQAESATARVQELEGHPEALQGFSLEALRVLVRDIGHGQDRARHALEHAESLSRASVEAAGARRELFTFSMWVELMPPELKAPGCTLVSFEFVRIVLLIKIPV
jgi:hypothetical protein